MNRSVILTNQEIIYKIRRIAYQIYENNSSSKEIIIAGITDNGFIFAKKIKEILDTISTIKTTLCEVHIDKENPRNGVTTSLPIAAYKNKSLV